MGSARLAARLLKLIGIVWCAVTVTARGAAGASTVPDDEAPGIVIVDEGKGDERFDLDQPMIAGTRADAAQTTVTSGTIAVSGTQSLDAALSATTTIEQSVEVTAVAPDGGYTITRVVDSYDFSVTEGPAEIADGFREDDELEPLVGIPLEQVYDADGQLVSIALVSGAEPTEIQQASFDTLIEDGRDRAQFPDVALGVGAVWTSALPGTKGDAVAEFELTAIDDGVATIAIAFEGDPTAFGTTAPSGFDDVAGSIVGAGSYEVNLENPIESTFELALQLDMTLTGEGLEMVMDMESTTTRAVTAAS